MILDYDVTYYVISSFVGFMFFINPMYIEFLFYSKKVQFIFKFINLIILTFLEVYGISMIDNDINSWSIYFGCLILGYLIGIITSNKLFE